jgi:hypothetical protein
LSKRLAILGTPEDCFQQTLPAAEAGIERLMFSVSVQLCRDICHYCTFTLIARRTAITRIDAAVRLRVRTAACRSTCQLEFDQIIKYIRELKPREG